MEWVLGSAGIFFVSSAGLRLFAQHATGRSGMGTVLLALYLAFWSYVLGIVCLVYLSVRWVQWWLRMRETRAAMSGSSAVEVMSRSLERPDLEAQCVEESVASGASIQSTRETDGPETTGHARVA